jgi:hypothetical protein
MEKQDKKEDFVVRQDGELDLLLHGEDGVNSSCSFDFLDTSSDDVSEDMIWEYFARIIGDIYLEEKYGYKPRKKSSNIL